MILYLVSHAYQTIVSEAVAETGQAVLKGIVEEKLELNAFMKQQINQFQVIDPLLIDLNAVIDSNTDTIQALSSFRLIYNDARIIVFAPNRSYGDMLLSEIFCMGIYDIVIGTDEETLKQNLIQVLQNRKSYKDSISFKVFEEEAKKVSIQEKVIIRNSITLTPTVSKAVVGFMGSMSRIGVTHNLIVSAMFLKEKGFTVAAVEYKSNATPSFAHIKEYCDVKEYPTHFNMDGVDFYPTCEMEQMHFVYQKNYNFVLIDYGYLESVDLTDVSRCMMQIVVCGTKPWEYDKISNIFELFPESLYQEFNFLFNWTHKKNEKSICEGMAELEKVFFVDFNPDPFEPEETAVLECLFRAYLPTTLEAEPKKKYSLSNLWRKNGT